MRGLFWPLVLFNRSLTPEHLSIGGGVIADGFYQARIVVYSAHRIDPFRDWGYAQKITRRRPR
jgi:hypothetical protein